MGLKKKRSGFQALYLFFCFLLFASGLFLSLLFFQARSAGRLAVLLVEKRLLFSNFGLILIFLSLMLFSWFAVFFRKRSLKINVSNQPVEAAPELVAGFLQEKLKSRFPKKKLFLEADLCDEELEIGVHLERLNDEEKARFLKQLEQEIKRLLKNHFYYRRDFSLELFFS
ncbi:MAG: hypothetical protein WC371_01760 [Parachlamydiales bacterium]|jgi:hypothetical protein